MWYFWSFVLLTWLSFGSEFLLTGFGRSSSIRQLAEIMYEISKQQGFITSPGLKVSFGSYQHLPASCPSGVSHSSHCSEGSGSYSAKRVMEVSFSAPYMF